MIKYSLFLIFFIGSGITKICWGQDNSVKTDSTPNQNSTTIDRKDSIQYFDQITQQPVFYERRIYDSTIKRIKNEEAYWYADKKPDKKTGSEEKKNGYNVSPWLRDLVWILMLLIFITGLIWYLVSGKIRVFRKAPVVIKEESPINYEEDIFSINYDSEIKKALDSNDYRLAIRLLFLRALKELNDNEIIVYKSTRTNTDYLFQLYGTVYYKPFFRIVRIFDYVWYGKLPVSSQGFKDMQEEFIQFNKELQ